MNHVVVNQKIIDLKSLEDLEDLEIIIMIVIEVNIVMIVPNTVQVIQNNFN